MQELPSAILYASMPENDVDDQEGILRQLVDCEVASSPHKDRSTATIEHPEPRWTPSSIGIQDRIAYRNGSVSASSVRCERRPSITSKDSIIITKINHSHGHRFAGLAPRLTRPRDWVKI